LNIKSIVEIACGYGIVADGLRWVMPGCEITQFDMFPNPEWTHLKVSPFIMDVNEFIKTDKHYDLVIFLNSYRNWDFKEEFNKWLEKKCRLLYSV